MTMAGRDRRANTPAQARNFLDAMRGLFRWAARAKLVKVQKRAAEHSGPGSVRHQKNARHEQCHAADRRDKSSDSCGVTQVDEAAALNQQVLQLYNQGRFGSDSACSAHTANS